jgi:hypothetical protein
MSDQTPKLVQGFTMKNGVKLMDVDERNQLWAFESTFKGRELFRVSTIFQYGGDEEWNPGKGFSVPLAKKAELIEALKKIA